MNRQKRIWLGLIIFLQCAVVIGMVGRKQLILLNGKTMTLKTMAYDPHSLFSGDYARLTYDISALTLPVTESSAPKKGECFFVELAPSTTGWFFVAAHSLLPSERTSEHVYLRGTTKMSYDERLQPVTSLGDYSRAGWLATQPSTASWRFSWNRSTRTPGVFIYGYSDITPGTTCYVHFGSYDGGQNWAQSDISTTSAVLQQYGYAYKDMVTIKGIAGPKISQRVVQMEYGLETFYVPEGKGRPYERGNLNVDIAVDARGNSVIKKIRTAEQP